MNVYLCVIMININKCFFFLLCLQKI
ncbi:unnamed protein product [Spirodela intermedia]|uniref:Uncharacterized protein n=1 Tax=Spirodela intermedia TaxID=51605 RepID=A0A7I8K7B8_SPIIN|nr:unnamed protein product [Spirodela intermedia]